MPKLKNHKHELFCHEYLIDSCATDAAIRAGYASKCANRQGSALMARSEIKTRVGELQRARIKRTDIQADEVIYILATILRTNSADFVTVSKRNRVVVKPTDEIDEEKMIALAGVKKGAKGAIEVKQYDKIKAAELLMRHMGMLNDKIKVEGAIEIEPQAMATLLQLAGYKKDD